MTTPRSRLMAGLTVVAMLAIGIVVGIGVDRRLLDRRPAYRGGNRGGGGGNPFGMIADPVDTASRNRMRARIVKRITDDLTLTADQARAIDAIFARNEAQLDSLRVYLRPRLDSLRTQMRASMDSVYTPEQRIKSAELRKQMEERRRGGRDARGGPRGD